MVCKNNWNLAYLSVKKSYKELPWIRTRIPQWFKDVIDSKWISPCKTLDVGCGNGYYSYYLSKKGYFVKGIDVSEDIINYANNNYKNSNLTFKKESIFSKELLDEKYKFIIDIGLLHNILPEDREKYINQLSNLLEKNGKLLVFCFDKRENTFNNKDVYLNSKINIYSYPLSREEIISLFSEDFLIEKISSLKYGTNNYKKRFLCLFKKK